MKKPPFAVLLKLPADRFTIVAIFLCLCVGVILSSAQGQRHADVTTEATPGVVSSNLNPLQIALLHWYGANQTTQFTAGSSPSGVAFDGENIWVANNSTNRVTKLRANDGASLGSFPVGAGPTTLAYDGANIWVANGSTDTVTKLRGSTGAVLGTFTV